MVEGILLAAYAPDRVAGDDNDDDDGDGDIVNGCFRPIRGCIVSCLLYKCSSWHKRKNYCYIPPVVEE